MNRDSIRVGLRKGIPLMLSTDFHKRGIHPCFSFLNFFNLGFWKVIYSFITSFKPLIESYSRLCLMVEEPGDILRDKIPRLAKETDIEPVFSAH